MFSTISKRIVKSLTWNYFFSGCAGFIFLFSSITGYSQTEKDHSDEMKDSSSYYVDYSDLLAVRIYTNTKWNTLEIIREEQRITLRPNSPTSLGAGFNYKGYGLALAFGLPVSAAKKEKYGNTSRFDFQANVYGKKIGFDGFGQIYKGYYMSNPNDFLDWQNESFPQLPDMKVLSAGINFFYLFNDEKFSYKAAFIRNQIQEKSAGSFTIGIFGNFDASKSDQGYKPVDFPDSIGTSFDLKAFSSLSFGFNVGYLYTWVISKKFFINVGVTPGFGNQRIELETIDNKKNTKNSPAAQLTARSAIGIDTKHFYMGASGFVVLRNFEYKGYDLDLATEQVKVFIGKRINILRKRKP
jgi:hypothetical protein